MGSTFELTACVHIDEQKYYPMSSGMPLACLWCIYKRPFRTSCRMPYGCGGRGMQAGRAFAAMRIRPHHFNNTPTKCKRITQSNSDPSIKYLWGHLLGLVFPPSLSPTHGTNTRLTVGMERIHFARAYSHRFLNHQPQPYGFSLTTLSIEAYNIRVINTRKHTAHTHTRTTYRSRT